MGGTQSRRAKERPRPPQQPQSTVQRIPEGTIAAALVDSASWSRVIVEVHPNLWLGSREAACNPGHLRQIGVDACVNVTQEANLHPNRFDYFHLPVADSPHVHIIQHVEEVLKWVNAHLRAQRGVLIYCTQGVSRSATLMLALLLNMRSIPLLRAWEHVRRLRKVRPNSGFLQQLIAYETKLRGSPSVQLHVRRGKHTLVPVTGGPTASISSHRVV
jgi:protein-tyrosine phosphatase